MTEGVALATGSEEVPVVDQETKVLIGAGAVVVVHVMEVLPATATEGGDLGTVVDSKGASRTDPVTGTSTDQGLMPLSSSGDLQEGVAFPRGAQVAEDREDPPPGTGGQLTQKSSEKLPQKRPRRVPD